MQCMGSPKYCFAAERTERLVSISTVTLDWRMAWRMGELVLSMTGTSTI